MESSNKLLVVGARTNSLGHSVSNWAMHHGMEVVTAGVSGDEFVRLDVFEPMPPDKMELLDGAHVVCTAGINEPGSITSTARPAVGVYPTLKRSMEVNCLGPLMLLANWFDINRRPGGRYCHFVGITSNSAEIARSGSLPYCTSKAALAMGLRASARDVAKASNRLSVYQYQPGWLGGTPMSDEVGLRLESDQGTDIPIVHRMLTPQIDVDMLATMIVHNLQCGANTNFNGCSIRIDGGEQ